MQDQPISARSAHRERVKITQNVAAGIARELRNPVFAIVSAAQLLRYRISTIVIEKTSGAFSETERLNALIECCWSMAVGISLARRPDDVWTNVLATHAGCSRAKPFWFGKCRRVRASCLDVEQLAEAFSNALANAIDAAPEGSDLTILSARAADGAWQTELHNDGPPIAADLLPHAFEPLVTNKPGHAGIGLAVVHRIITEHGGTVALESTDGDGTTLTCTIPAARLS